MNTSKKVVVVHRGARDSYQVSRALAEEDMLDTLVTDLYWPQDRGWAKQLAQAAPASLRGLLQQRTEAALPSQLVEQCSFSGATSFLLDKAPRIPFSWRRRATRWADASLGRHAGRLAERRDAALLSYSYYGYHAFGETTAPGILFQLHPHPASVRSILGQELRSHPECASSLNKEWELALPQDDFDRLVVETQMASCWMAASSFTRQTLVENGIPEQSVHVIPYGVNLERFAPPRPAARTENGDRFKLLFVGTITQRKGITYLLEALKMLAHRNVELTVCGRVIDDLSLFKAFPQVNIRPSVSASELLDAYRTSDLFVFPSLAEGFGHVLLESLACGLPILTTTSTAAPDLITNGVEGFIVEPRRPQQLAERIEWAMLHRRQLAEMRLAARYAAEQWTWARFRHGVRDVVRGFLHQPEPSREEIAAYV